MPIDDEVSALRSLNESDERQSLILPRTTKDFLAFVRLLAKIYVPPAYTVGLESAQWVLDWIGKQRKDNRRELLDEVARAVERHGATLDRLIAQTESHQEFVRDHLN